jgi:hypothetical protein
MRKGNLITVVRAMRANCEVSTSNKMVTVAREKIGWGIADMRKRKAGYKRSDSKTRSGLRRSKVDVPRSNMRLTLPIYVTLCIRELFKRLMVSEHGS